MMEIKLEEKTWICILVVLFSTTSFATFGTSCSMDSDCTGNNQVCDTTCICGTGYTDNSGTCDPVDCGTAPTISNGGRNPAGLTTYNEVATYTCDPGYTISTLTTVTCQTDTTWETPLPVCTIKNCGSVPAAPSNGAAASNTGTTYQETATYTCNSGYVFSGGASGTISCQASGSWDTVPTCSIVATGTSYQDTIAHTCNNGYAFSGGASGTIYCQASGSWQVGPTCVKDCGTAPATLTNGVLVSSTGTTAQSTATYTCNDGYVFSGTDSGTITCQDSGTWETVPTCMSSGGNPLVNRSGWVNISLLVLLLVNAVM